MLWNISTVGVISGSSFASKVDIIDGTGPVGIIVNDVDGDGKNDLIISNHDHNTMSIYKNISPSLDTIIATSFALKIDFLTGSNPWDVVMADLSGDGKPDFITTNWNSANISILANANSNGSIILAPKVDFLVGNAPRGMGIGDLDGDGQPDVAITTMQSNTLTIYRNIMGEDLSVKTNDNSVPSTFSLYQNYPNPFNPSTVIQYGIPEKSRVKLEIFNLLGQKIATLVDAEQDARYYDITWNPTVSSGIYFYKIQSVSSENFNKTYTQIRKMIFIK